MPRFLVVMSGVSRKLAMASPKIHKVLSWVDQVTLKMQKHLIRLKTDTTI